MAVLIEMQRYIAIRRTFNRYIAIYKYDFVLASD